MISLEFHISTKPLTLPPDELDFRVTNFYKFYDRKTQNTQKKLEVKQKTGIFPHMPDVLRSVCFFIFFQEGLKLGDRCTYLNFEHSDLFPVQDAVLQLRSYTSS